MNKIFSPPPGFKFVGWVTRPPIDDNALIEIRRVAARLRQARWRAENIGQARAIDRNQRRKQRDVHYNRPFWAIDSEGQRCSKNKVEYDGEGVPYHDHATYLWGACAQDGEPIWLKDPPSKGLDKRPLHSRQIIDWLLDLPKQASRHDKRGAVWVIFSFGYDITQILKGLPYKTAWEICKGKTYPDENGSSRDIGRSPVLWGGYAISYLKGKYFRLWRLRDPDHPFIINKKGKRVIDASAKITVYDAFGFFGESFSKVADSMVKNGRATEDEAELIRTMKALRGKFDTMPLEQIEKYTTAELRLLARQMTDYRDELTKMNLRLAGWHGAGAAAAALFRRERFRDHFGDHISAEDISPQQEAANYAMFGARIELLKQGFMRSGSLFVYDIASAYPAGMIEFPSMKGGRWLHFIAADLNKSPQRGRLQSSNVWPFDQAGDLNEAPPMKLPDALGPNASLRELRAAIEAASPVSMFKIRFEFPIAVKSRRDPIDWKYIPFFPLPYRTRHGEILFPANGYGWYVRDDALAAIAWLERFCPNYPARSKGMVMQNKNTKAVVFEIEETWFFEVAPGAETIRPFESIRELYNERRAIQEEIKRTGVYDIREKLIKLVINSIYGKLAQSVGQKGVVPPTANPYFAAATTAYCRRRLMEAALIDPDAIVFFATDGIVSIRPLTGLDRVRKSGDKVDLGDWEYCEADGGLFVLPGVYTYGKAKYDIDANVVAFEPVTKMRGANPKNFTDDDPRRWFVESVLAEWRKPFDINNPPCVEAPFTKYLTAGNALASRDRWKLAGRWSPATDDPKAAKRRLDVHSVGNKRMILEGAYNDYASYFDSATGKVIEAKRTRTLIRTIPALNKDGALSRPRSIDWLDEEYGRDMEELEEQNEIWAGFE